MSDLVEANRLELMKWLNKDEDALDWTFRAEKVAVVEGYTYVAVFKLLTQYLVYELYNARLPIFFMKLFWSGCCQKNIIKIIVNIYSIFVLQKVKNYFVYHIVYSMYWCVAGC